MPAEGCEWCAVGCGKFLTRIDAQLLGSVRGPGGSHPPLLTLDPVLVEQLLPELRSALIIPLFLCFKSYVRRERSSNVDLRWEFAVGARLCQGDYL